MDNVLSDLRQAIDHLDAALMFTLAERTHVIVKTGVVKKRDQIAHSYSEAREQALADILARAVERHIPEAFLKKLFERIYQEALVIMTQFEQSGDAMPDFYLQLTLEGLRESLYNLDVALCHLLAERFHVARQVGQHKKTQGLPILAPSRWEAILETKKNMARSLGVDPVFIEDIMNLIHETSLNIQLGA